MKRPSQNKGISLVEILVAAAIVSILAALAMPALRSAQNASKASTCTANLKQIFQLTAAWSLDNNGYVPQGNWNGTNLSKPNTNLVHYGLTPKLTKCPASQLTSPNYGISSRLVTGSPDGQWGKSDYLYHSHGKYKLALLSPRTIVFAETGKLLASHLSGSYLAAPEYSATPHSGKGNVVYADGHIEMLDTQEMKKPANWTYGLP